MLGFKYELYPVETKVKDKNHPTKTMQLDLLLPHEMAHVLFCLDPDRFRDIFQVRKLQSFWEKTIAIGEPWLKLHPLYNELCQAEDKSTYLAILVFGDDGCMKKRRMVHVLTWYSALYTEYQHLHSRFPAYMLPGQILIGDVTEPDLQEAFAWSLNVWIKGVFPRYNHRGERFPSNSFRAKLAEAETRICGGYTAIYTGTVGDQTWIKQHYRYEHMWSNVQICPFCVAENAPGPRNFTSGVDLPLRSHESYMESAGARLSPLTRIAGFHNSLTRPELMHVGPLGCMPDHCGSALVELCESNCFGFSDIADWQTRMDSQLKVAFIEFNDWARSAHESHSLNRFTRARLAMTSKSSSWPQFKTKAHNLIVVSRWLAKACKDHHDGSRYSAVRAQVLEAWALMFDVASKTEEPDFHNEVELRRFNIACKLVLHGSNALAVANHRSRKARWKTRPKLHLIHHINSNAQISKRVVRAFWSFKEEEGMGKLARIAVAVHGACVAKRSLQRWCVQFFNASLDRTA